MLAIDKLPLRHRVNLFIAIAISGLGALSLFSYMQSGNHLVLTDRLLADVKAIRAAGMADMMHDGLRASAMTALVIGPEASASEKAALRAETAEYRENFFKAVAAFKATSRSTALDRAIANVEPIVERYVTAAERIVESALTDRSEGHAQRPAFDVDFKTLEAELDRVVSLVEEEAQANLALRDQGHARERTLLLTTVVVLSAILLGYGLYFTRSIFGSLGAEPDDLRRFAQSIAQGELFQELSSNRETQASVGGAMVAMRDRLRETVVTIRQGADSVANGTAQIATGNQDLSDRTEHQAANLQQTAASMEQITGAVTQSAAHAQTASRLAAGASEVAIRGGVVVEQVVETMNAIQSSSQQIADITNVIDGIAFQTNILALNAAVEAARAGEQGRGFAVVASEVRGLAQRSASAAREIKALIAASVARIDEGGRLVGSAGETMNDVVTQVKEVSSLIVDISAAAVEQTNGIAAVRDAVAALDQGTQRNTALVEESAAAARTLSIEADRVRSAVGAFKLEA